MEESCSIVGDVASARSREKRRKGGTEEEVGERESEAETNAQAAPTEEEIGNKEGEV